MKRHTTTLLPILFIITGLFSCSGFFSIETDKDSYETPKIFSGPADACGYAYAPGIIDAAAEGMGVFLENSASGGSFDTAKKIVSGEGYLGMVREDVFLHARDKFKDQYDHDKHTGDFTQEKSVLKIASQLQTVISLYEDNVYLLVNTDNITDTYEDVTFTATPDGKLTMIDLLKGAQRKINIGPEDSDTYMTAYAIGNNYVFPSDHRDDTFTTPPLLFNDEAEDAIAKVVSGDYDAAFFTSPEEAALLKEIDATAPVQFINVHMPQGSPLYNQKGIIRASDFPFQTTDVTENILVKTLLVMGPGFKYSNVQDFIDTVFLYAKEYQGFSDRWEELNRGKSEEYFIKNPQMAHFDSLCHIFGVSPVTEPKDYFYAGDPTGHFHDKAVELIWLLSHNLDVDLKEHHSTGGNENAIRILDGSATMALVQDDIFQCLASRDTAYESIKAAAMKKIMPLDFSYIHLISYYDGANFNVESISDFPGMVINLGEKTSGTFMTAMNIINSYEFDQASNITYYFDDPIEAIDKVDDGTYDATFLVSPYPCLPDNTFNATSYPNIGFSAPRFKYESTYVKKTNPPKISTNVQYPYSMGFEAIDYTSAPYGFPNSYPPDAILYRIRNIIVKSPGFNHPDIATFIKSVYRKASYLGVQSLYPETYLAWEEVTKEHGKDYFVISPFGWCDDAVKYYLSLFPEEE